MESKGGSSILGDKGGYTAGKRTAIILSGTSFTLTNRVLDLTNA